MAGLPADGDGRVRRASRVAVTAYFVLYGVVLAVWVTGIPEIKQQLRLSDGLLGLALLGIPAGVLLVTLAAGRLADRVGSARVTQLGGIGMPLALITPALAGGVGALIGALLVFGIAAGTLNVGMNANGVLFERASGRRVMTSLHAGYSLGGLAGAVAGGLLFRAGVGLWPAFLAVALPGAALAAVASHWLLTGAAAEPVAESHENHSAKRGDSAEPDEQHSAEPHGQHSVESHREHSVESHEEHSTEVHGEHSVADPADPRAGRRRLRTRTLVLLLGLVGLCALLAEGAAADWSAVYLRDDMGTSAGLSAAGFAAFSVAMAAGRLLGDRLAARVGAAWLVRAGGALAAAGLAGGLISGNAVGGIAGFAVLGAGLSGIAPQVFLAGGQADPARPGHGLAQVVGLSYLGMVGGPAVIGLIANVTGLPIALGLPVAAALCVAVSGGIVAVPAVTAARPATKTVSSGR